MNSDIQGEEPSQKSHFSLATLVVSIAAVGVSLALWHLLASRLALALPLVLAAVLGVCRVRGYRLLVMPAALMLAGGLFGGTIGVWGGLASGLIADLLLWREIIGR